MKLGAILLARLSAFVDVQELSPRNQVSVFKLAAGLQQRYNFRRTPQSLEDFDVEKDGIQFASGSYKGINIESLIFYLRGIVIDTRSSTSDCGLILDDIIEWVKEQVGGEAAHIARKVYLSQLVFYTDRPMNLLNPHLEPLMAFVGEKASEQIGVSLPYEITGVHFNVDDTRLNPRIMAGRLVIERREETPFTENKYFSSAPLGTEDHIEFLERFEAVLR